jgi:hypothetical protein
MYRNPGCDMSSRASVRIASDASESRSTDRQAPGVTVGTVEVCAPEDHQYRPAIASL